MYVMPPSYLWYVNINNLVPVLVGLLVGRSLATILCERCAAHVSEPGVVVCRGCRSRTSSRPCQSPFLMPPVIKMVSSKSNIDILHEVQELVDIFEPSEVDAKDVLKALKTILKQKPMKTRSTKRPLCDSDFEYYAEENDAIFPRGSRPGSISEASAKVWLGPAGQPARQPF